MIYRWYKIRVDRGLASDYSSTILIYFWLLHKDDTIYILMIARRYNRFDHIEPYRTTIIVARRRTLEHLVSSNSKPVS